MPNRSNLKKNKEREGRREAEREGGTEGAKERRRGEERLPYLVHSLKLQSIMAEKAWQQEHETAVMWDPQSTHLKMNRKSCLALKPQSCSQRPTSSGKAPFPKGSTSFPNSTTSWAPGFKHTSPLARFHIQTATERVHAFEGS